VPVRHRSLDQCIDEVEVADPRCFRKHWSTFRQAYAKADGFGYHEETLETAFREAADLARLSEVNVHFLRLVARVLDLPARITDCRRYELLEGRNERLVALCLQAGANRYVSGPAARSYLDEKLFEREGIAVEWMDYGNYPEYEQPHPPFDHFVSVLDLLGCIGERARDYLKSTVDTGVRT
jgi:WbqC-like protein family.